MMLKRRKREKMGVRKSERIRCPGHLTWLRSTRDCAVSSPRCLGGMEAHHVRENGNAGTGIKPPDSDCIPLCSLHHAELHSIGAGTFQIRHACDLDKLAAEYWRQSPHGIRWRAENGGAR